MKLRQDTFVTRSTDSNHRYPCVYSPKHSEIFCYVILLSSLSLVFFVPSLTECLSIKARHLIFEQTPCIIDKSICISVNFNMECRLVLNNRNETDITNKDMSGLYHQCLKYYKFHRVQTRTGKSIFYLFFRKEEDTYFALRAAKSMKEISLVRYRPSNPIHYDQPFRPFPSQKIIDLCRYALRKHLDKFADVVGEIISINSHIYYSSQDLFKTFLRRLCEQIIAQCIKIDHGLSSTLPIDINAWFFSFAS